MWESRPVATVCFPEDLSVKRRASHYLSVRTFESLAAVTAIQWIERNNTNHVVISCDCSSALYCGRSLCSQDVLLGIFPNTVAVKLMGYAFFFLCIPAMLE